MCSVVSRWSGSGRGSSVGKRPTAPGTEAANRPRRLCVSSIAKRHFGRGSLPPTPLPPGMARGVVN